MLRTLGQAILTGRGYQVLLAEDGRQAVEIYERERSRIELVILDLSMPRLSGRDAMRELLRLNPQLPILLASGYGAGTTEAGGEGLVTFIDKPYRPDDLANAVRLLLDRGADSSYAVGRFCLE
jgi:CheY-like chemotaxis protein